MSIGVTRLMLACAGLALVVVAGGAEAFEKTQLTGLTPGEPESLPRELRVLDDRLFFIAETPGLGREVWRSDGTSEGTGFFFETVPGPGSTYPQVFVSETRLFFIPNARVPVTVSDGTLAGTGPLGTFVAGTRDNPIRVDGDSLIYADVESNLTVSAVFSVNGSSEDPQTLIARRWRTNEIVDIENVRIQDGLYYFSDPFRERVWRTDGTDPGTENVTPGDTFYTQRFEHAVEFKGGLAFPARPVFEGSNELYLIDPNDAVARRVQTPDGIAANLSVNTPGPIAATRDAVFFTGLVDDGRGWRLWKTDGGPDPQAELVLEYRMPPFFGRAFWLTAFGDRLLFEADTLSEEGAYLGAELWISDGTTEGTKLLKELIPGNRSGVSLQQAELVNDLMFFTNVDIDTLNGVADHELWMTDGTPEGTVLVDAIEGVASTSLTPLYRDLTALNGFLLYTAPVGLDAAGQPLAVELFRIGPIPEPGGLAFVGLLLGAVSLRHRRRGNA